MTNIFQSPAKQSMRDTLLAAGYDAVGQAGWMIEKVPGVGKSSVRRLRRGSESLLASFKSTQDTWLAFSRTPDDNAWSTLEDVDVVVVISVDDRDDPKFANVHLIDRQDLVSRFDRAYRARLAADHKIPIGRGVWISLYEDEKQSPVNLIGAGVGNRVPPLAKVALTKRHVAEPPPITDDRIVPKSDEERPLTIPEAKRRLALTFGVDPSAIKISVEG